MIIRQENIFLLNTVNTSYMFHILPSGHAEHLFYGKRLMTDEKALSGAAMQVTAEALREKCEFGPGNAIAYSKEHQNLFLEDKCLEFSSYGKGDVREPFVGLEFADGSRTCDFLFKKAEIHDNKEPLKTLPSAYAEDGAVQSLEAVFEDKAHAVEMTVTYAVFEECDAITRSVKLSNKGSEAVTVERLMSAQLDFHDAPYRFTMFHGHWAREMKQDAVLMNAGRIENSSVSGVSSSRANPFVIVSRPECCEDSGECIGINLLYSGNHCESLSVSGFGKTRFVNGINPDGFSWELGPGCEFEAPEAVMSFSALGFGGMSRNMHEFVREHIVRGAWKKKERPILINSWEAAYFKFNEGSLLKLARSAKNAGIELFVLDDGWFGERDDDHRSLGDWRVNTKKLPGGLKGLADRINALGMMFGIWVEPEMVNENSDLYRAHPDWAVRINGQEQSLGRDQMILDLTRCEVQENIIAQMEAVFRSGNIEYVKWDMNRIFSDSYSYALPKDRQQEFSHRYVLGLYHIMDTLVKEFPNILFEGCASGGNRFDLGILSYFPQVWGSDDTDAMVRSAIQRGYSYGYPQSVIGSHVSACPNHQTMRNTPIGTRFAVASCGAFGYELNLSELSDRDFKAVSEQTAFYKQWREVLQFGDYYRLPEGRWMTVAKDRKRAAGIMIKSSMEPNMFFDEFRTAGLDDGLDYKVTNRVEDHDISDFGSLINSVAPVHIKQDGLVHQVIGHFVKINGEREDITVPGSVLNSCGLRLKQGYGGTGYNDDTRIMKDFDARMYLFTADD